MTDSGPQWLDKFLFYDSLFVSLLLFVDWLIGETKREEIRDKAGEWWLHVQEYSYKGLAQEDAAYVKNVLSKIFGSNWLSFRFIFGCVAVSFTLSLIIILLIITNLGNQPSWKDVYSLFISFVMPNAIFDWLSLSLTYYLLGLMEKSNSFYTIIAIIIIDLVTAIILGIAVAFSFLIISGQMNIEDCFSIDKLESIISFILYSFESLFCETSKRDILIGFSYVYGAIFTGILPSLFHLIVATIFLGSKLIRPVGKPIIGSVLYALHDSKKGVLSILAVGFGALAKLIQYGVKMQ